MFINNNQDNNDSSNNGGIYSKFQERLRKIRLARTRKKQQNNEFVDDRVKDIRKTISGSNSNARVNLVNDKDNSIKGVVTNIRMTAKDRNYGGKKGVISVEDERTIIKNKDSLLGDSIIVDRKQDISDKIGTKKIENIEGNRNKEDNSLEGKIDNIRENRPNIRKNRKVGYVPWVKKDTVNNITVQEKEELLQELGAEIIDKIKESFLDKLDEIEVLESELYLLSLEQKDVLELKKVKDIKKRINELIDRINVLIEQYNLYKKNYYIDNVIGIDDSIIVDDIINYRDLLDSFENEKEFVKEIKALEEFKSLYNDLKEIRDETEKLQNENEEKIEEYGIRDKKYNNIKIEMVKTVDIGKNTEYEIEKQNKYFTELMSKVNHIEKQEYVTTHLRGVGNLIGQSLRFMGLMLVSPLTGLLPGIGMQTLAARRMVGNAYRSLHFEDVNHVSYSAIDYDSELNHHLNDVNYVEDLVDNALRDVDRLKEDFIRIYDSKIPGYEDALKKIEKLEKKLMHNQNKVSIVKKNLKKSKKLNEDKMVKVRQLNDGQRAA